MTVKYVLLSADGLKQLVEHSSSHNIRSVSKGYREIARNMEESGFNIDKFGKPTLNISIPEVEWMQKTSFSSLPKNAKIWNCDFPIEDTQAMVLKDINASSLRYTSLPDGRHRSKALLSFTRFQKSAVEDFVLCRVTFNADPTISRRYSYLNSKARPDVVPSIYDIVACFWQSPSSHDTFETIQKSVSTFDSSLPFRHCNIISRAIFSLFPRTLQVMDKERALGCFSVKFLSLQLELTNKFLRHTSRNLALQHGPMVTRKFLSRAVNEFRWREEIQVFTFLYGASLYQYTDGRRNKRDIFFGLLKCVIELLENCEYTLNEREKKNFFVFTLMGATSSKGQNSVQEISSAFEEQYKKYAGSNGFFLESIRTFLQKSEKQELLSEKAIANSAESSAPQTLNPIAKSTGSPAPQTVFLIENSTESPAPKPVNIASENPPKEIVTVTHSLKENILERRSSHDKGTSKKRHYIDDSQRSPPICRKRRILESLDFQDKHVPTTPEVSASKEHSDEDENRIIRRSRRIANKSANENPLITGTTFISSATTRTPLPRESDILKNAGKSSSAQVECALRCLHEATSIANRVLCLKTPNPGNISKWPIERGCKVGLVLQLLDLNMVEELFSHLDSFGAQVQFVWIFGNRRPKSKTLTRRFLSYLEVYSVSEEWEIGDPVCQDQLFIFHRRGNARDIKFTRCGTGNTSRLCEIAASCGHLSCQTLLNFTKYQSEVFSMVAKNILKCKNLVYIALDNPTSYLEVYVRPILDIIRREILLRCSCGGHEFLSAEFEKSANEDPEWDRKNSAERVPFTMVVREKDFLCRVGLKRHPSMYLNKTFGGLNIREGSVNCHDSISAGQQLHMGLYLSKEEIPNLLSTKEEHIDIIYPSCILQDVKSAYRNRHALSNFEMREYYTSGISHDFYAITFRDSSLASAINEHPEWFSTVYDPQYTEKEFLQRLKSQGHAGMKTWVPISVRINMKRFRDYWKKVICPKCNSVELFADYGVQYQHY